MTTLNETILVNRPPDEAFAYVSDFTTTTEWDSTAREAKQLTPGRPGQGTEFLVNCAVPGGSLDLHYTITRYEPPEHLVLRGVGRFFEVEDTISFRRQGDLTKIDYRADFNFPRYLAPLLGAFQPGLERMGRASVAGLQRALEDNFSHPEDSEECNGRIAALARLAGFTRFGYRRARKSWHPMSASMSGKHALITGTSSGIGLATARDLARRGAALTLVMRNAERAQRVHEELVAETGNHNIQVQMADLSLMADVDALSARLLADGRPVDILVNNAGALFNELAHTDEGLERSVALLLLSPYRLTLSLKPLLEAAAEGARVVNVVSGGMYTQKLSMDNLVASSADNFSGSVAYARAKRALMVVTRRWASDWQRDGIVVNAMHPGWADTPGVESSLPLFHSLTRFVLRSPEEGADTIVWLAVATEAAASSGKLYLDRKPQPLHLQPSTRESTADREKLFHYLADFAPADTRKTLAEAG